MAFSGKFVVRIDPQLHESLKGKAQRDQVSLNRLCATLLQEGLEGTSQIPRNESRWAPLLQPWVDALRKQFNEDLIGVVLFGSRIRGDATSTSDLDLLVILSDEIKIERRHYHWWDSLMASEVPFEINPHFVHLPKDEMRSNGIWYEVALHSEIFWEKDRIVSKKLDQLREVIASSKIQRFWTNGHPYWVRSNHEKH
ncbi:MAG: nucleotidyltransferase domain-containing protein [Deltaproteobacteria bacterium]|nr:nucleotidyltransferase domain-containing protein [Deltaproteobacteria bacterium]